MWAGNFKEWSNEIPFIARFLFTADIIVVFVANGHGILYKLNTDNILADTDLSSKCRKLTHVTPKSKSAGTCLYHAQSSWLIVLQLDWKHAVDNENKWTIRL